MLVSVLVLSLEVTVVTFATNMNNGFSDYSGQCTVNRSVYRHGQNFTIPGQSHCLKYRCNNGYLVLYQEGCEYRQACHPVGSSFDNWNCITYTCTRSSQNGKNDYNLVRTRIRCKDYNGACRELGSQFPKAINGQLHQQCTCTLVSNGLVRYGC